MKSAQRPGGKIIGQQYVKGKPLKGQSRAELTDAVRAAETDAADAVEKDRIPRIYRKGVRNYFDRLDAKVGTGKTTKPDDKPPADEKPAAEKR